MIDDLNNPLLIDATGMNCPLPLMMLKKAVDQIPAGAAVLINVTDAHAELDFEIWCEKFNHELEKLEPKSNTLQFRITKANS